MTKLKKPQYRRPLVKTERIELRCSPEEKDSLHAHAHLMGMTCSAWIVKVSMAALKAEQQGASHE